LTTLSRPSTGSVPVSALAPPASAPVMDDSYDGDDEETDSDGFDFSNLISVPAIEVTVDLPRSPIRDPSSSPIQTPVLSTPLSRSDDHAPIPILSPVVDSLIIDTPITDTPIVDSPITDTPIDSLVDMPIVDMPIIFLADILVFDTQRHMH